jgi:hypothetical protein
MLELRDGDYRMKWRCFTFRKWFLRVEGDGNDSASYLTDIAFVLTELNLWQVPTTESSTE